MTAENRSIFDYSDYKKYLAHVLPTTGAHRGSRSRLADALQVQTAFVSRVFADLADFSLEHAVQINRFLEHTEQEGDYFMLLVQLARAGSLELESHFRKQLRAIQAKRTEIKERIQVSQEITREDQARYYSAWYYAAIHVLLTVPAFQEKSALSKHLALPITLVSETLDFFVQTGLAAQDGARYRATTSRIHLGSDSPMIGRHHTNWRMQAIQALDRRSDENLFFSGPISLSEEDAKKIRARLLAVLEELEPVIRDSKEEAVFCLGMDFFRV